MNSENYSPDHSKTKDHSKTLEFVVLEEGETEEQVRKEFHPSQVSSVPFSIRLLCLFIGTIALLWFIVASIACIIFSIFGLFSFFKSEGVIALIKKYWLSTKRSAAVTTSLFIAFFSPQLGFVVLLSYFIIQDEAWQKGAFASIIRSQFHDYM